jgi:hypothetical protein
VGKVASDAALGIARGDGEVYSRETSTASAVATPGLRGGVVLVTVAFSGLANGDREAEASEAASLAALALSSRLTRDRRTRSRASVVGALLLGLVDVGLVATERAEADEMEDDCESDRDVTDAG